MDNHLGMITSIDFNDVANLFMAFEPLVGKRHVEVTNTAQKSILLNLFANWLKINIQKAKRLFW